MFPPLQLSSREQSSIRCQGRQGQHACFFPRQVSWLFDSIPRRNNDVLGECTIRWPPYNGWNRRDIVRGFPPDARINDNFGTNSTVGYALTYLFNPACSIRTNNQGSFLFHSVCHDEQVSMVQPCRFQFYFYFSVAWLFVTNVFVC
ncbi:hypothetical protein D3C73_675680 [compost metagenome]